MREGTVNLPACTSIKKAAARQALIEALRGSLGSSLEKSDSMTESVKGSHLGHLEDGGARLAVLSSAALTWMSFMDHG